MVARKKDRKATVDEGESGAIDSSEKTEPSVEPPVMIRAEKVFKVYESGTVRVEALKNVDLLIRKGEMVAVMGPSGCGKTTLLNCLSGLDDLTSGNVWVEDKEIASLDDNDRTEHRATRMGFIFQHFNLQPVLTALENVEFPLLVSGRSEKEAREKAIKALEIVGLLDVKDHTPSELSGGQQQKTTLARSLVNEPALVWADEPTGNLDTSSALEIMELLRKLNRELGQTYIMVTHDPEMASFADRLITMRNGQIVADGPMPKSMK